MSTTLENQIEKLAAEAAKIQDQIRELKKQIPAVDVGNPSFQIPGGEIQLSELFGEHSELILIFNMGVSCRYCTLWADEYNGVLQHLQSRAGFVVSSPDAPETQSAFAKNRNWQFQMVQSNPDFRQKLGFEKEAGDFWPGYSVFQKDDSGQIKQVNKDFFGPGDHYCGVWHFLAHLPSYKNDWQPQFKYADAVLAKDEV